MGRKVPARVQCLPYSLPFARPFRTARQTLHERQGVLVCIEGADGAVGLGEAAPLPGFGMESPAACLAALRNAARVVAKRGLPEAVEALPTWWREAGLEALLAGAPAARHGLESALLDHLARRAGVPLAALLANDPTHLPAAVPCNATLGDGEPADCAAQAGQAVAAGFRTLKLKVGAGSPERDDARVRAVRTAVGPAVALRLDANGAWDEALATRLLAQWAPLGLDYVEQPLPAADLAGMARLAHNASVRLAADEAACTPEQARRVLAAGAAQVLVLKPMALGGPLPTLAVVRDAAAVGVPCVVTTMLEGVYGRLAALHTAAAAEAGRAGAAPLAHGLATGGVLANDLLPNAPAPVQGTLPLPEAAGLGVPPPRTLPPEPAWAGMIEARG